MLLHGVAKLSLLRALDDFVVLGVDVEAVEGPWNQTQDSQSNTDHQQCVWTTGYIYWLQCQPPHASQTFQLMTRSSVERFHSG